MALFERVRSVVAKELDKSEDQITPDASFTDDLGADSLDVVQLVMSLEEEFHISIPDEDAEKIRSVGDAVEYIEARTTQQ